MLWDRLGVVLGALGAILRGLGALLGGLGALLGPPGATQNRAKNQSETGFEKKPNRDGKNGPNTTPVDVSELVQTRRHSDPGRLEIYRYRYRND